MPILDQIYMNKIKINIIKIKKSKCKNKLKILLAKTDWMEIKNSYMPANS